MGGAMSRWILAIAALLLFGCTSKHSNVSPVTYRVTGFDSAQNTWVVDQVDNVAKTQTRYVLVCDFYQWGKHKPASGPTQCDLTVGEQIVPNPLQQRPGEFVDVWPRQDKLSITSGKGGDQVIEQFTIKSATTLPFRNGN